MSAHIIPFGKRSNDPIVVEKVPETARDIVQYYLDTVFPARGNGATDCGEMMDSIPGIPLGDHFLLWLAERGFMVIPMNIT